MPTGYPALTSKQKQEIITRIRDKGEKVPDLAKEYGVWSRTIYNLLKNKINQPNIALAHCRKSTLKIPYIFSRKFATFLNYSLVINVC